MPYYVIRFDKLCQVSKEALVDSVGGDFADMAREARARVAEVGAETPMILESRELMRLIEPSVAITRRELNEPRVPFDTYADAIEWLEHQASKQRPPSASAKKQFNAVRKEWAEATRKVGKKPRSPETLLIRYLKPARGRKSKGDLSFEEWESAVPVWAGSKLGRLAERIGQLARATGFSEAVLTAHVLAGTQPIRHPVRITHTDISSTLPDGATMSRFLMLIEIKTPQLSSRFFGRTLQRRVRESWGEFLPMDVWGRSFDRQLERIVDQLGGPPTTKYSRHFWASVYERCENEGLINQPGLPAYKNGYSLATRYYRTRGDR